MIPPMARVPSTGRYQIRRITLGSAVRVGLALGWLVMLCPAAGIAWLAARILQRVADQIVAVKPIAISILGQDLAQIDVLQTIGVGTTAQTIVGFSQRLPYVFLVVMLAVVVFGALAFVVAALLFSLGYNLLAWLGGGLVVELSAASREE